MKSPYSSPTLVMNIKRRFFAAILSVPRRKRVEYRKNSLYWRRRLARVGRPPFNLRFLNGMTPPIPEATVRVVRVVHNRRGRELEFHLGRVLDIRHWNRARERPAR